MLRPKMVEPKPFHPIFLTWLHLLLLLLPQRGTKAQSSTQPLPLFATQKMWGPSMAVVIGALIGIFLLVAMLLLYLRRCTESYFTQHRTNHHPCSYGIHPELLHTFPTLFFSTIKHLRIGKVTLECAVCLAEFTDSDTLRLLPQCNHVFHPPCIDQWLSSHVTCPVCRADLNQGFNQVPILVPTQLNVEGSGSRAEAEQGGGGESEIERCPAREGKRMSDENKGVRDRVSKSKLLRRSNSTGHSVLENGECVERYTLRLPEDVRKYILLNHGVMQRSASYHVVMPVVGSSRKGLF